MENCERFMPIGIVEIYDTKTGELVYKTHNMIVETGRKLIINAIFGGKQLLKANFKKFYETTRADSANLTTADMTIDDVITENRIDFDTNDILDVAGLSMKINLEIKNIVSTTPITSIGTIYNDNGTEILFSRAAIDPVYMRPGRTYKCNYTMYF